MDWEQRAKEMQKVARLHIARGNRLEAALNEMVNVLGCGGEDRFIPAFDPHQDNDREALEMAKRVLTTTRGAASSDAPSTGSSSPESEHG